MDLLSEMLEAVRLDGAVFFQAAFSSPWTVRSQRSERLAAMVSGPSGPSEKRLVLFHYIAAGTCWAEVDGERRQLDSGDVIVFPYGDEHTMGQGETRTHEEIANLFSAPPPWPEPPRLRTGGGGAETHIVCGFLRCDQPLFNPLLEALPKVIVVPGRQGATATLLRSSLAFLEAELARPSPGAESVRKRLTEVLFVEVLRKHASSLSTATIGWLAALDDEAMRRALEAIHAQPEKDWSVEDLARRAAMSRSVFYERFTALLGQPPAQYLMRWRLQRAAQHLLTTDLSLAEIADRIGYGSETALSRAFKRTTGQSPGAYRKQRR